MGKTFTILLVLAVTCGAVSAQTPCTRINDDAERLKCFDTLSKSAAGTPQDSWATKSDTAPLDDSPQFYGMLPAESGRLSLVLRCHEREIDAVVSGEFIGSGKPVKVVYRIDEQPPVTQMWLPAGNGQGAFARNAWDFMTKLPDNGRLFVRLTRYSGEGVDGRFSLGDVSAVRNGVAAACSAPKKQPAPAKKR